jgi:hypothetical protein
MACPLSFWQIQRAIDKIGPFLEGIFSRVRSSLYSATLGPVPCVATSQIIRPKREATCHGFICTCMVCTWLRHAAAYVIAVINIFDG